MPLPQTGGDGRHSGWGLWEAGMVWGALPCSTPRPTILQVLVTGGIPRGGLPLAGLETCFQVMAAGLLASWPLWSFHSCWQSHRTPSASVHITAVASTFKKEEKERKRQREEVRGRKEDRKEGSGKGKRERALSGKNRSLSL